MQHRTSSLHTARHQNRSHFQPLPRRGIAFAMCPSIRIISLDIFPQSGGCEGHACGAIVVTKHGCANFMPTYEELMEFVTPYGGL